MYRQMTTNHARSGLLLALLATTLILAACAGGAGVKGGQTPPAMQGQPGQNNNGQRGTAIEVRGLEGVPAGDRSMFKNEKNPLSTRIIYFKFDSSAIAPKYAPVIQAHASYLAKHPRVTLRLEGHTDERGTREYNIALGERRAESVEQALVLAGASDSQITTLSFGEERPAVLGSTPQAYAKNRRVEFIYVE